MEKDFHKLQFITHCNDRVSYAMGARLALEGGCRWIQLRMKDASLQEVKTVGLEVQALCKQYKATFIIDDYVEIAKEIHADGVHLGLCDMPIEEARHILGNSFIIGGTANTFEDVKRHYTAGANYIGCGPFRFTHTKKNLSPILGVDGYSRIIKQMKEENINLPLIAIGGITIHDIPDLMKVGVNGIAMSSSILQASQPIAETQRIIQQLNIQYND